MMSIFFSFIFVQRRLNGKEVGTLTFGVQVNALNNQSYMPPLLYFILMDVFVDEIKCFNVSAELGFFRCGLIFSRRLNWEV